MRQTILVPKADLEHINELTKMTSEEIRQKYGYEKDTVILNSALFPDDIEARIQLIVTADGFAPITEIVLYSEGKELTHQLSMSSIYEGEWKIEYNGVTYEVEVKPGLKKEEWEPLLKEKYKAEEFKTDSDLEDFANEYGVRLGDVYDYIFILTSVGTPCERCKYIGFRYRMSPCNSCSRNPYISDMFESEEVI